MTASEKRREWILKNPGSAARAQARYWTRRALACGVPIWDICPPGSLEGGADNAATA